jgi:hypothetical protein
MQTEVFSSETRNRPALVLAVLLAVLGIQVLALGLIGAIIISSPVSASRTIPSRKSSVAGRV